jgi:hypothetical protein
MACSEERFRQYCRRYGVRNFELVPGFYSESLPKIGADFLPQGQIAFAYIDCDLYASTLDVLRFLRPRLQPGMILAFDDYFCVNRTGMSGEARAFRELYMSEPDSPFTFEPYIQYGWAGMSFVVATR